MAKVRVVRPGQADAFKGIRIASVVLVILVALLLVKSTYYQVASDEVAVVTRFGAYQRTTEPGLHFKWPWGVEDVQTVKVRHIYKEEFGFRTLEAATRTRYDPRPLPEESLMLTGDLNAADVDWIVQFQIANPRDYLFKVQNVEETLRNLSESVMRSVVGDRSVFEVLTQGRSEVNQEVKDRLQAAVSDYEMGLTIQLVQLQTVDPPSDEVKASFNDVNQAEQERERTINQAQQEYNQIIPTARGEAEKTIKEAEGYAVERINKARGEAARFLSVLTEYEKAPEVTRRRMYLEMMGEVMPAIRNKIIIDEDLGSALPLLHLGNVMGAKQ